ncbi:MAG: response regulator transcription factor [Cyclobacteriaceae bacterium]|nr:response regulator transcription factor [Cyclobacteriaceae bacterium]
MSLQCLIVDDEPLSLDVLDMYIRDTPGLLLAGRCLDAFEAMKVLKEKAVDIIFLDINMPKLSGLNMVRTLEKLPEIVFTTAYPEYAVEGFELNVLDYLVKPISFERFTKAVNKAFTKLEPATERLNASFIMVKTDKRLHRISISDILYIQSMGDFIKIHTRDKTYIESETLRNTESLLPADSFVRIHKSYIISVMAFKYIEGNQVKIGDTLLPIGLTYKEGLLKALNIKNES